MNLPPPTTITDAEWLVNLGIVFGAIVDQLGANPETVRRLRNDEIAVVVHAQRVGLIAKVDVMGLVNDDIITGFEDELRDAAE